MFKRNSLLCLALLLLVISFGTNLSAESKKNNNKQETKPIADTSEKSLGKFDNWSAKLYFEQGQKVCHIWNRGDSKSGKNIGYSFITHRPSLKRRNEVSFSMGTALKTDAPVTVILDKKEKFDFFAHGDSAFFKQNNYDLIIKKMQSSKTMSIEATAQNNEKLLVNFSLSGIGRALSAINNECKG